MHLYARNLWKWSKIFSKVKMFQKPEVTVPISWIWSDHSLHRNQHLSLWQTSKMISGMKRRSVPDPDIHKRCWWIQFISVYIIIYGWNPWPKARQSWSWWTIQPSITYSSCFDTMWKLLLGVIGAKMDRQIAL